MPSMICLLLLTFLQLNDGSPTKAPEKDLSKSILNFTLGLSHHHSSSTLAGRRDLVWSPLSLYEAMLMVTEGADGKTLTELQSLIHLKSKDAQRQWSNDLLTYLQKIQQENRQVNTSLTIANRLYADDEFGLDPNFNQVLKQFYHSQLELIDFSQGKRAATRINSWIANQTNQIIKNVLKPTDINSLTKLMIVNALHFKAPWAKPFDSELTRPENFTLSTGRSIEIPMMELTAYFSYYHDKKHRSQWINLPYKGNHRYVLTLALPDKDIELRVLEKKLLRNEKTLSSIFNTLDNRTSANRRVQLLMPKFRIETSMNLVEHFQNYFKVKAPFDADQADFSPMSSSRERDLFISKIIHKAVIDVDEAGTEAAAVTVIQMLSRSGMFLHENPVQLIFSRPFLFYLRDVTIKVPLFVGRFTGIAMP